MIVLKVTSIVIISVVLAVIVRGQRPEYVPFVIIAAGVVIWAMISSSVESAVNTARTMIDGTGVNIGYIEILFKSLGICILTQISSDICRDANESALATKAELAGKVAVLTIAMPMITSIAQLSIELINQ